MSVQNWVVLPLFDRDSRYLKGKEERNMGYGIQQSPCFLHNAHEELYKMCEITSSKIQWGPLTCDGNMSVASMAAFWPTNNWHNL